MPIQNGWLITDAGKATVSADAVADAVYNHGAAFKATGARFVILDAGSIAATAVLLNGTAHTADGAMYYVTSLPSPVFFNNGIAHNERGSMYVSTSDAQRELAGIGVRDDGALCVTGI